MLICGRGPHFLMVTFDLRSEGQPNQLTAAMATIKGAWVLRCWLLTPANDKCRTLVQEALLSTKWCQLGGKLAKLKLRCKSSCSFPEVVGSYCNRYHFWWHWMVFFLRFFSAHRFNFTICFGKGHYEVYHLAGKGAKVLEGGEPYISQDTQSGGILSNLLKMQESFPWFKRIGDKKTIDHTKKSWKILKGIFNLCGPNKGRHLTSWTLPKWIFDCEKFHVKPRWISGATWSWWGGPSPHSRS